MIFAVISVGDTVEGFSMAAALWACGFVYGLIRDAVRAATSASGDE